LFAFHRSAPAEGPVLAAGEAPPAVMLRPVPAGDGPPATVIASSWQTVQRVSAEQPAAAPEGGPAVEVAHRPETPAEFTAPVPAAAPRAADLPAPGGPVVIAVAGGEPGAAAGAEPAPRILPQPQLEAGAGGPPVSLADPGGHYAGPVAHHAPYVPREFAKRALSTYIIEPPDILLVQGSRSIALPVQPIEGQHLVRPDGTIGLGVYGSVFVAGLTIEQARDAVAALLKATVRPKDEKKKELSVDAIKAELDVDVLAYNSKYYYIVTDGGGFGEQVYRVSVTGNETVLDALAQINGLPAVASKKRIWLARATPDKVHPMILPVDWRSITQCGSAATNYQLFPGDRIYVQSDALIRTDSWLAKFLAPIERTFGAVLLGSATVNSIRNGGVSGAGTGLGAIR
jgi:polysaccharide export outer membrane protein